jgi:hypothetical protein
MGIDSDSTIEVTYTTYAASLPIVGIITLCELVDRFELITKPAQAETTATAFCRLEQCPLEHFVLVLI